MTETPSSNELQGDALKAAARLSLKKFITNLSQAFPDYPSLPLFRTLNEHFDDLGIDWDTPRTTVDVKIFPENLFGAISYAQYKTDRDPSVLILEKNKKERWKILSSYLNDPALQQIIQKNAWRYPITFYPERVIPLPYILSHHFGNRPIIGVDFGTSLHTALSMAVSDEPLTFEFSGKEQIRQYATPPNITLGIGVDKQDGRSDVDWVQIRTLLPVSAGIDKRRQFSQKLTNFLLSVDANRFPFILADVTKKDECLEEIRRTLRNEDKDDKVDFILTSFMRHQIVSSESSDLAFRGLIADLLKEGGIWIDMGGELVTGQNIHEPTVKVYEKKDGKIIEKGTPFTLLQRGLGVKQVNTEYFATS